MTSVTSGRRAQKKPPPLEYGDGSIFQRRSDGRWIVCVRINGKNTQIGSHRDETGARAILDQYHQDRADGLTLDARDWSTNDWLHEWLMTKRPRYDRNGKRIAGVEPTTYEKYEIEIRRHIEPFIGQILAPMLIDVRPDQVLRWQLHLNDLGRSADTQRGALMRLSTALELAVDYEYLLRNPTRRVERPVPDRPEHVQPSELDIRRLLRAIDGQPLEALVWIALGAGLRRAEVAALEWQDVSLFSDEHGEIRANKRRNRIGKRTQATLNLPGDLHRARLKTQAERVVPIGGLVIGVLKGRWRQQLSDREREGPRWKGEDYDAAQPSGYLFTTPIGTPLEVDKISEYMASVRESAGLDIQRFHGLRRVFTTLLSAAGVHNRVTMELAGHASRTQTDYYQQPMESQMRDAAQALDQKLRDILAGNG
jgi:integrase